MKREVMDKSLYFNGIKWTRKPVFEDDKYLLNFYTLDPKYKYNSGKFLFPEGIFLQKEDVIQLIDFVYDYALLKEVAVVVSSVSITENHNHFTRKETETLAFLNLDVIPEEYRTKEWLKLTSTKELGGKENE